MLSTHILLLLGTSLLWCAQDPLFRVRHWPRSPPQTVHPQFSPQAFTSADWEALQATDCRKATEEDKLDPYLLKLFAFCHSLMNKLHIYSIYFYTGIIPEMWKSPHVFPLHMGGDKNGLNNYWPISKLSLLAKIL